jgi:hypothetical protein
MARDRALVVSAIAGELRLAVRCFALSGRRREALEHCGEVQRLSRACRDAPRPPASLVPAPAPADLGPLLAWDGGLALLARTSEVFVDTAELVRIAIAEA